MKVDPIRGKTIRWTFKDGPMAKETFEHSFDETGTVSWCMVDGNAKGKPSQENKYEVAPVSDNVCAVSYLGSSGYALTVVLDFRSRNLVAFASNEKELVLQHGTFEVMESAETGSRKHKNGGSHASSSR
jgi:MoaF N-terminal domain